MIIYSHSKLSTFEQCPLKFKFRYIDNLIPDIKQTIEGFLGEMVHRTLERIYSKAMNGNILELDEVMLYFAESWKKFFSDKIKIIKEDLTEDYYFRKGIKFLIDYYNTNFPFKDNTIALEKKILIKLDEEGKYFLQGYIDRLVHNKENNVFEIHDYKTTSFLKTQDELDQDRQLSIYSIGILESFVEVNDIHLIWHFLDFNKKMTSKRTKEQLNYLKIEIINLIKKIESVNDFPPNPGCLCKWCEFRSYCIYKDSTNLNNNSSKINKGYEYNSV